MAQFDGQARITLVIPQKYLDILKQHVEKGSAGQNAARLDALIASGCLDFTLRPK